MNTERYWESAIAEAASGRQPPDQTAEILARLNAPPVRGWAARPWPVRVAIHAGQTAIAAGVLLAIGLATGVVQWPGPETQPITPPIKRELIATPGTKWVDHAEYVDLGQGALLLSTGAPEVRRGESKFNQLEGLALLATGEPDARQMAEWQTWMQTKGVEKEMLKNATRWITGTALCVLMLQGTATLDGQKVEAEKPAEPVWHKVNSLMALEKLPPEAKYIEARYMAGTYLPLIAEVSRIEGLRFAYARSLKAEHVAALGALPSLCVIDLRGATWEGPPDYSPLLKFPKLERVGLDLYVPPRAKDADAEIAQAEEERIAAGQIEALREFARKGLKIDLSVAERAARFIGRLVDAFPDCEDLTVASADDEACRDLARFRKLKRLSIRSCSALEPGYAWLSRLAGLEYLWLTPTTALTIERVHQLAKLKNLRVLHLNPYASSAAPQTGALASLAGMSQLRELHLSVQFWPLVAMLDGGGETPFKGSANLEVFTVHVPDQFMSNEADDGTNHYRNPLDLGFLVGARKMVVWCGNNYVARLGALVQESPKGGDPTLAARLETIRLVFPTGDLREGYLGNWVGGLKRYPNLKHVELVQDKSRLRSGEVWTGTRAAETLRAGLPGIEVTMPEAE